MRALRKGCEILGGKRILDESLILSFAHVERGDVVILSGTLVEGIGNEMSDLDVYVITASKRKYRQLKSAKHAYALRRDLAFCEDEDVVFQTMDYYPSTSMHLDIEYWTYDEVEAVIQKALGCHQDLLSHCDSNYTHTGLSRVEHLLLHRLRMGVTISGSDTWRAEVSAKVSAKYAYTLYRDVANQYWDFKDVVGAYVARDAMMCVEQARQFLIREVRGAFYLRGVTNYVEKWHLTYLKTMPPEQFPRELRSEILAHLYRNDPAKYEFYLFRTIEIIDAIEDLNRSLIDSSPIFLSCAKALEMLGAERTTRTATAGPAQEHEFLFRERTFNKRAPSYRSLFSYFS